MEVRVADTAGFCMGVKRAIEIALDTAHRQRVNVYTYGPLIHNPHVLEMLERKKIYKIDDPSSLKEGILLVRTHGIPPSEREKLEKLKIPIIDATCPRVFRIHRLVMKYLEKGFKIILFGDPGHAEVTGIMGFIGENGWLVSRPEDIDAIDAGPEPLLFVAQTTKSRDGFEAMKEKIEAKFTTVEVIDTLCATTEKRQREVKKLAQEHDAVVVVGGRNSANTARLAEIARNLGKTTYHVQSEEELPTSFPEQVRKVAVTAGASTPNWMIERVVAHLEDITGPRSFNYLFKRWLMYATESYLLVAAGSICFTITCSYYLNGFISLLPIFIAGLYVYSMHILNHLADRQSVALNEPLREEVFKRHQTLFFTVGTLSGLAAIGLSWYLSLWAFLLLVGASAVGAVYSFHLFSPMIINIIGYRRLKDIPASKDIVVAAAWTAVTAVVPLFAGAEQWALKNWGTFIVTWLGAMILVYVRSVLLDLKDIQGDRIVGKETIPIMLGEKKALRIVTRLLGAQVALLVISLILRLLPPVAAAHLLSLLPILFVVQSNKKKRTLRRYAYQSLLDFSFIMSGVITLLYVIL